MSEARASEDWAELARDLERWFAQHQRPMPWRAVPSPYATWVSEVMLQQTQVATVIPYFERFMARFPDPHALAAASEDEVHAAWAGLGYYRRARLLHAGVRELVAHYDGDLPQDPARRAALPGIGPYTNGAIGSIAFGLREAIVDGNVARVLSRLLGLEAALGTRDSERALWSAAQSLVDHCEAPAMLNQGLMELGALVCRKAAPNCALCPLQSQCVAHVTGRTAELPVPRKRPVVKQLALQALILRRSDGAFWLEKPTEGVLQGLWSPPLRPRSRVASWTLSDGTRLRLGRSLGQVSHVLTHRRMDIELREASETAELADARGCYMDGVARAAAGLSRLAQKIIETADAPQQALL